MKLHFDDSHWQSSHTTFRHEPAPFNGPAPGPSVYPRVRAGVLILFQCLWHFVTLSTIWPKTNK